MSHVPVCIFYLYEYLQSLYIYPNLIYIPFPSLYSRICISLYMCHFSPCISPVSVCPQFLYIFNPHICPVILCLTLIPVYLHSPYVSPVPLCILYPRMYLVLYFSPIPLCPQSRICCLSLYVSPVPMFFSRLCVYQVNLTLTLILTPHLITIFCFFFFYYKLRDFYT